ncbi:MAG TPA: tRNA lysidine(34) synthetase TilS, partial [Pseudomonadales bacterium]|nr:tRNA lysidine(34) synthetase TilS [Pseudomonadales bacterium]
GRDGSRSVKRLLHDAGVAPWLRADYPLLYVDGILAAVPGLAIDRAFADPGDAGWRVRFDARR